MNLSQRTFWFGSLALAAALFVSASATRAEDTITMLKGEPIKGKIVKEDMEAVQIQRGAGNASVIQPIKRDDILEIDWDVSEREWREGAKAFKEHQYGKAAECFKGIFEDKEQFDKFRAVAKPALFYMLGESYLRSEKYSDAKTVFEKFIGEYKTSSYMPFVVGSMVDVAIVEKTFDKVPKLLAELRAAGGESRAIADNYEGKSFRAQGRPREALACFTKALNGSSLPTTRGMALMGQAGCAVDVSDSAKARDLAQKALANNPPPSVAGAAHIIIGDTILADIDSKGIMGEQLTGMLMDASLEYLRVHLQYRSGRDLEAKALYKAGECFLRLAKVPGTKGFDRQRANAMFSKVKEDFRGTTWAKSAEDALKKLNK